MTITRQTAGHDKLPPLMPRMLNTLTAPGSSPAPMLRLHKWIYTATDGRIGPGMIGAWTLLLQTAGRRSGQRRTSALVFARDGARLIVAPIQLSGRFRSWNRPLLILRRQQTAATVM